MHDEPRDPEGVSPPRIDLEADPGVDPGGELEGGVYLDNNATTPVDPRVVEAMVPWLSTWHGNPSSSHAFGRRARAAVEEARARVAALLGGRADEVVFVSSGTEANNMVLASVGEEHEYRGRVIVGTMEHPSIRAAARRLAEKGMQIVDLPPSSDGRIDPARLDALLADEAALPTRLVCLMLANNELGTVQPVARAAEACRRHGAQLVCDAVQAVGKIPVDVRRLGADFVVVAGHKFHGPPGVAAMWIRPGTRVRPLLVGGGQEAGSRASTENLPAIVGLGLAAELARLELDDRFAHLRDLRAALESVLTELGGRIRCAESERLPNTVHVGFPGFTGQELMQRLDDMGIAVSTGAACHAGRPVASRTLLALGLGEDDALSSLRLSVGMQSSRDDVARLGRALGRLLAEGPRASSA